MGYVAVPITGMMIKLMKPASNAILVVIHVSFQMNIHALLALK